MSNYVPTRDGIEEKGYGNVSNISDPYSFSDNEWWDYGHFNNISATYIRPYQWCKNIFDDIPELQYRILLYVAFSVLSLVTIIGNIFVMTAIKLEKKLQQKSNILIASLSVTDLMVGIIVMPTEIFGHFFCLHCNCGIEPLIYLSRIFFLSASVCHLVAIAIERCWAITNFHYMVNRSLKRIIVMIVTCWSTSIFLVFIDDYFGVESILLIAFISLIITVGVYIKIYRIAKMNIHSRLDRKINSTRNYEQKEIERKERQREHKAIKTVAIITGVFILCWCPIITYHVVGDQWNIQYYERVLIYSLWWLAYCNSAINPVIYTVFNPNFKAFFFRTIQGKSLNVCK